MRLKSVLISLLILFLLVGGLMFQQAHANKMDINTYISYLQTRVKVMLANDSKFAGAALLYFDAIMSYDFDRAIQYTHGEKRTATETLREPIEAFVNASSLEDKLVSFQVINKESNNRNAVIRATTQSHSIADLGIKIETATWNVYVENVNGSWKVVRTDLVERIIDVK